MLSPKTRFEPAPLELEIMVSTSRKSKRKPHQKGRKGSVVSPAVPVHGSLVRTTQDIINRKHPDENIQKSESLLAQAEQLANLGSWEWDLETGAIIWSDNMYRLRGFAPREVALTKKFCSGLLNSADRKRGKEILAQTIASGQPGEHEFRCAMKDGSIREFQTRFSAVISESRKVLRIVGTTQDITNRKLAEENIRKGEVLLAQTKQAHAEEISANLLELLRHTVKGVIGRKRGVYVLSKNGNPYYIGLAKKLPSKLSRHLKERHAGKWDRFTFYAIRSAKYVKNLESLLIRVAKPAGNRQRGGFGKKTGS